MIEARLAPEKVLWKMTVTFDGSFIPGIEDETIEVDHLVAEPKNEHVLVDGSSSFDNDSQGKCLKMKDVSCKFEDGLKANNDGLDSNTILGGEDDMDFGGLDGFLDEVDEIEDIHATDGLSDPCDNFLLDFGFGEKVSALYCIPHEGSRLGSSSSKCRSPRFNGASKDAVRESDTSTETIPELECQSDIHDRNVICPTHDVLRTKCKCWATVKDDTCQNSPASLDPQDSDNLESDVEPFAGHASYRKKKKRLGEATKVRAHIRLKRTCNPIKRYIDEPLHPKSKGSRGRPKISLPNSKDKRLEARSSTEHHHMSIIDLAMVKQEFVNEASIHTPGGQKKQQSTSEELESDEVDFITESEDNSVTAKRYRKSTDRRKHQRMWTSSEVSNLVDGISQYGVGKWTDIKRLLFASSTYRTPMDLRDKWRNLVRASRAQEHVQSEVEQNSKRASHSLPISLLRRISELATIHPYPCHRKSDVAHDSPFTLPSSNKVDNFQHSRRNRKKCTT